jgi:hypothetical protein
MNLKIIFIILAFLSVAPVARGQSCGGGTSTFHIFDEDGTTEIRHFYISLQIVSEDQLWRTKDFGKSGWKRQKFGEETAAKYTSSKKSGSFETAFEISYDEYSRLLENREKIIKKAPDSLLATTEKDRCGSFLQESVEADQTPFSICTREGCGWMVVAAVQAKDYETAYFVSDFTCGCTKHYELRLKKKPDKCLCK